MEKEPSFIKCLKNICLEEARGEIFFADFSLPAGAIGLLVTFK